MSNYIDKAPRQGQLFIISAPSGTGKTSLVRALVAELDQVRISISHTTRPQRPGEENGVDYYFVDSEKFERLVTENRFLEHAKVFGNHYGTSEEKLIQQRTAGTDVILEIDWQGAQQVRTRQRDAISIFIVPPSFDSLVQRLHQRGRDEPETIAKRLAEAMSELSHYREYDYVIVNDDFDQALRELRTIVSAARLRRSCRSPALDDFVNQLIAQAREIQ